MSPEIIAGTFSIIGAFAGAIIGHWSATVANKRILWNEAANKLRSVFLPITSKINTCKFSTEPELREAIICAFDEHAVEIERFKFYVRRKDRQGYEKAYDEYSEMVTKRPIGLGSGLEPETFYLEKVNDILRFAKPM